jgi:23S rRNA (guanosine2251-2'-O)-methyltransferase
LKNYARLDTVLAEKFQSGQVAVRFGILARVMASNHLYGLVPVLEALRAQKRPLQRILIAAGAQPVRIHELIEAARRFRIPIEKSDRATLDKLTNNANHQGVVALIAGGRRAEYVDPTDLLDSLRDVKHPLLVLLDGIEDTHNLGAILRSCEAAGVDGVFLPEHRSAGLNDTVAKTSAGAVEYVRVAKVTNLSRLIEDLKARHIWVVGVEADGDKTCWEADFTGSIALVLGSEGKGIRRLVREHCDWVVSIPMFGQVNSLNVSVATGVVLFEALRQRRQAKQ